MKADDLCPLGAVFAKDEEYILRRYEADEADHHAFLQAMEEAAPGSILLKDENYMKNSWKEALAGDETLQLKVMDKRTKAYVGYVMLQHLDTREPELGIQLLQDYQHQGIGSRVMRLFVERLRMLLDIDYFYVRIKSDNYASQRLFEGMGAVTIGEEGSEYTELMRNLMEEMGREAFEAAIQGKFEQTQRYIICYMLKA